MRKEIQYIIVRKKDNKVFTGKLSHEYSDDVFKGFTFRNRQVATYKAATLKNWLGRPKLEVLQIEIRKSK